MKKHFLMNCHTVLDTAFEAEKDGSLPLAAQIRMSLHCLFCPACAGTLRNLRRAEELMKSDFFPPSPDFEEALMARLSEETSAEGVIDAPAGFSFRGWVITGFFVLLSLSSAFLGVNFIQIPAAEGSTFLLSLGLTIGMVLTCYGALFIGSHLKELSVRFGIR